MADAYLENARELIEDFVEESIAALETLPAKIEACLRNPADDEPLNAVFRAVHSVKGNAAFFGFVAVKSFAHALENTLDEIRRRDVRLTPELAQALLCGFTALRELVEAALHGQLAAELPPAHGELLTQIAELSEQSRLDSTTEGDLLDDVRRLAEEIAQIDSPGSKEFAQRLLAGASPAGQATLGADLAAADEPVRSRSVRIKEERLDDLLQRVTRLMDSYERLMGLHACISVLDEQGSGAGQLGQLDRDLWEQLQAFQRSIISLRRVPAGKLFAKFPRMARNLAAQLGKQVEVNVSGEELEIDKSLVDDLDAPLTHLIHNMLDHGIEAPAERRARGVDVTGSLWLKAEQSPTHVTIVVQDDGRGIDPDRVRRKAVEKRLLPEHEAVALSDKQAVELIFHPGFSTADKISEVSGRGVGMDVVLNTVREHDGDVLVDSRLGVGTTFRLVIPRRQYVPPVDGRASMLPNDAFMAALGESLPADMPHQTHGQQA